jgi:hypothetical protein
MFDYTHSTSMSATSYDFFGVAAHEVSEVMGRQLFVVSGGQYNSFVEPLELFKTGRPFNGATAGSFSIDGTTSLGLAFNNLTNPGPPVSPNGDFADWASSVTGDSFRAVGEPGKVEAVSATDLRVLDVLGYDRPAADIVFAIDTTGSMTPYIDNVKANVVKIINEAFGPSTAPDTIDARIGIVGFKDAAGPDGPGENTAILKFTEQATFAARKTAAINAVNSISVGGGGDIPEGDNSALLFALRDQGLSSTNPLPAGKGSEYALSGNFRLSAQSHKVILFSDAPIKDVNLAGQVTAAAHDIAHTTISHGTTTLAAEVASFAGAEDLTVVGSSDITFTDWGAYGTFTFTPAGDTPVTYAGAPVGDDTQPGPTEPLGTPASKTITAQVYVIQVGSDPNATDSLSHAAIDNGGAFFTTDAASLADTILKILDIPPPPTSLAQQDFNGDGFSDLLWQNSDGTPAVWLMNGTNIISGANVGFNPGAAWHVIDSGDFNGDGKSDILWQHDDGTVAEWFLNGASLISGGNAGFNPGPAWHAKSTGDFNGDGKSDILWQNSDGTPAIWLMNGLTILSGANAGFNPGPAWHVVGSGDFNGDGKSDILWQNVDGTPAVWLMNGTNLISGANVGFNPGPTWNVEAAADFNGDGKADILWQNDDGTAAIWFMNGTSLISGTNVGFNPGPSWQIHGAKDFNGDGKADIEWQNVNGAPAVWLMNGANIISGANVAFNPGAAWHEIQAHYDIA